MLVSQPAVEHTGLSEHCVEHVNVICSAKDHLVSSNSLPSLTLTHCCHAYRLAAALHAWRQVVKQSVALHQMSSSLAVQLQQRSMQRCLQAWQMHCLQTQAHTRLLVRRFKHKAQSRLSSTFQAWMGYVANFRYSPCQTAGHTQLIDAH